MLLDWLLSWISPHVCKGCGQVGDGLCDSCFFDITNENYGKCLFCGEVADGNLCHSCASRLPFKRAFVVGERRGLLKRLVGDFKYNSERGNARVIARLLDATLPILPSGCVVVPIPTIAPHIRQRGFGHTELIARHFARIRRLPYSQKLLLRADNSIQHGLKARERQRQAAKAFLVSKRQTIPTEILLLDDICTTGATVTAAAKLLKKAGVKTINLAIVTRHSNKS
jgi:ComF family protein